MFKPQQSALEQCKKKVMTSLQFFIYAKSKLKNEGIWHEIKLQIINVQTGPWYDIPISIFVLFDTTHKH
jgi:hypothetical protein